MRMAYRIRSAWSSPSTSSSSSSLTGPSPNAPLRLYKSTPIDPATGQPNPNISEFADVYPLHRSSPELQLTPLALREGYTDECPVDDEYATLNYRLPEIIAARQKLAERLREARAVPVAPRVRKSLPTLSIQHSAHKEEFMQLLTNV